ncbi:uncharacterized protein ACHE_70164A [Aspergillus chevalieri]|uniref:Uncharacterized protein n=1 Tax=Aspergillus chevalieri TaxID=182096 RepID=A0A7R7VV54_ASPCH|nr:uncharacterized protein ACHE_70164A [Aspergillus chevalieri]BCR91321.1 hypothetical protein ACHE_70164A [Aspergillus chevalieri]
MAWFPFNLRSSAPILMVSSFLAALAFSIGHHAFYQRLNDKSVLNSSPFSLTKSYHVSDQQVNVSVGTFFAFLVKALLGVAVSTVFDQFAWKSIKDHTSRIGSIDDLFSVLKNGFMILNFPLWRHYPVSMLLACIAWLLPVASIITPATLNVHMASFANSTSTKVPRVDFANINFSNLKLINGSGTDALHYSDSTPEVQQIVYSTAMQKTVLPITPPFSNSSWVLDFSGPALGCEHADDKLRRDVMENVRSTIINATFVDVNKTLLASSFGYLSWMPEGYGYGSLPFIQSYVDEGLYNELPGTVYNMFPGKYDSQIMGPLQLYMVTLPHMLAQGDLSNADLNRTTEDATFLTCTLYNASYTANFTYFNGQQNIQLRKVERLNKVDYLSDMYTYSGSGDLAGIHNRTAMETFSYQSIMAQFGSLLTGNINKETYHVKDTTRLGGNGRTIHSTNSSSIRIDRTSVMTTGLSNTNEFSTLRMAIYEDNHGDSLSNFWREQSTIQPNNTSIPLSDALEQLFQNITLSMMSSSVFQPNYSMSDIPDVNVTMITYRNIYAYSQSILWTAYGTALAVSFLSVILGVIIFFVNHGSYSSKFSTVMRTTRTADISTGLNAEDAKGIDPTPGHINNANIYFNDGPNQKLGRSVTNVEPNAEKEVPETVERTRTAEVSEPTEAVLDGGLSPVSDQESRPPSWFVEMQRDHGADH